MSASFLRVSAFLVFVSSFALAAGACGGQVAGNGHGGSSSGGSGGSGSSSGGAGDCQPLPGCSSTSDCPAGDGCNTCSCENGQWACTTLGCGDDEAEACPPSPPPTGDSCSPDGSTCDYPTMEGCGEQCTCDQGLWACGPDCPPAPSCPKGQPEDESACPSVGQACKYFEGCTEYACECAASDTWFCQASGSCVDAGIPVEAGAAD